MNPSAGPGLSVLDAYKCIAKKSFQNLFVCIWTKPHPILRDLWPWEQRVVLQEMFLCLLGCGTSEPEQNLTRGLRR